MVEQNGIFLERIEEIQVENLSYAAMNKMNLVKKLLLTWMK